MAFASFTNAENVLQQITSQTDDAPTINGSTLSQWLTTLQTTSTRHQQELQQQVAGHADTSFFPAYRYNNQLYQRADRQVKDAFTSSQAFLSSASTMATQTTQASSDTRSLADQAHHSHTIVNTLKSLVTISRDLDHVDNFLAQGAIVDATRQLLVVLDRQANEEADGDGLAVRYHLRTRAERYKTLLANTIHDGLTQSIVVTNDGGTVLDLSIQPSIAFTHGSSNTTLCLKDLLMASTLLQTQYVELASIQRNIVRKLITPLLDGGGDTQLSASQGTVEFTVDEMHQADMSTLHLRMTPPTTHSDDDSNNTTTLKAYEARCSTASDRLQHTLTIVRFVFDHLFGTEPHWLPMRQLFGRLFLPDVFQLIIKSILAPAIPSTTTSTDILARLASLGSSAADFEQQCIVEYAGITPPPSNTADNSDDNFPLARYVSQLDKHVAQQRHSRLLHDARQVMLRPIYDTEPDAVEGISVTQTPRILHAMIQELTAEAVSLEQQRHYTKTSQTLRDTTHAILILYMSIMPSIHRPEFLQHADRAIVFRNDCYWLATHTQQDASDDIRSKLERLGDLWQSVVVAQLMSTVAIVLERTEDWQLDGVGQLQRQSGMVLDTKQPIGTTTTISQQQQQQQHEQAMSLENAIAIIIAQVQSLANAIKPVVTTTLFNAILIELVNGVVGRLTDDILAMADISAEASHTMALALNGIAQLANVFLSDDGDGFGGGVSEIRLRQWIPRWQGFWMVKEMLELTMADILAALHRGDLCMFTHQELVHLVCALFADTPRREETIRIIKTSDLNGSTTATQATVTTTTKRDIASLLDPVIESPRIKHASEPPPPPAAHNRGTMVPSSHTVSKEMITSSSRLVFDVDETNIDDDGWDQEGWSDDDDLDFNITPAKQDSMPTNQETLPHGHLIGESRSVETDKEDELDHEVNIPMEKSADISLDSDNKDEFDSEMNMPLDDQDRNYLGIDDGNQIGKTMNVDMNQETLKDSLLVDPVTAENSTIDVDTDDVLDDESTRSLDFKDKQDVGLPLENEESYNNNESMETSQEQQQDSQSPEIEHSIGGMSDMNVDAIDALDHEMTTPVLDYHANHKDENDDHTMNQVEGKIPVAAQKHHEDPQSSQSEYPAGEISDMEATMIDDFNTTITELLDSTLSHSLEFDDKSDFNISRDDQDRLSVDDENEDLDSIKEIPLDDKVNQHLEMPVENDSNTGKDDNIHITQEKHEDSLSSPDEQTFGGTTGIIADKNDDVDSVIKPLNVSPEDLNNTTDALLNVPQDDKEKQDSDTPLEAKNDSGKNDYTQTHQEHYEGSEPSPGEELTGDIIKNNDGEFRTDIHTERSLDNPVPITKHEEESPLDDEDNVRLVLDAKDDHNKDTYTETTQYDIHDYQLLSQSGNDTDSNEENGGKVISMGTRTDTSKEKQHTDTWRHGSLLSDTHSMDMLLDDDEGGGWSDADHDIDLDLNLLSNSGTLVVESSPSTYMDHNTKSAETTIHTSHFSPTTDTAFSKNAPSVPSSQDFSVTTSRSYSQQQTAPLSQSVDINPPSSSSLLQHQQSPLVNISPLPSPSKFTMMNHMTMNDNFDDEGEGGWSDAENIMEFDTTFPSILPASQMRSSNNDQPTTKSSVHYHQPGSTSSIRASNNDTNTSSNNNSNNNRKSPTSAPRSNLMMDLALEDDDDIGGGWSDADEELF